MANDKPNFMARLAGRSSGKTAAASNGNTGVNPRKATTSPGTTLKSSTTAVASANIGGELGSSQPVIIRDVVPQLASAYQRLQTYTRMMQDAGVDVSIRAAKMPVLGAEFFVDPYSPDPQDVLVAEFINNNLFGGMNAPFLNSLEDILHMYEDGYAVVEKVHELRPWTSSGKGANTKQYTMLKKLSVRPPSTISTIDYDDNGGPLQITQKAIRADKSTEDTVIDISKLVIFSLNKNGGDLTGKSLLRTAYSHWYYKTHLYKIDAIQKERHSLGVPKGKLGPGYTSADKTSLRQLLTNLRSNDEAFMILTPNIDVEFASLEGQLVNVLESAVHHNSMILLNVLAQFLALGLESSGGGRATAGAQTDIFMKSLRYVAQLICDMINMYVIPELVIWNFNTTNFPVMRVRNLGEARDLQMLAAALSRLIHEGALIMDEPTQAWVRRTFDMPAADPTTAYGDPADPNPTTGGNGNQKTKGQKNAPKQNGGQGNVPKTPTAAE